MIKTYQAEHFFEVVGLLSNVCKANELEQPRLYFKDINIKPKYDSEGNGNGFTVSILTGEDQVQA